MSPAAFLAEIHDAGIRLSVHGDGLRVEATPGALSAELRARLAAAKRELVALLQSNMRSRLRDLADMEGLRAATVDDLDGDDVAACHGLPDETLRAYVRLLDRGRIMDMDRLPASYTQPAHCGGCGTVWLWPGAPRHAVACPWCPRRKLGQSIPRPPY